MLVIRTCLYLILGYAGARLVIAIYELITSRKSKGENGGFGT